MSLSVKTRKDSATPHPDMHLHARTKRRDTHTHKKNPKTHTKQESTRAKTHCFRPWSALCVQRRGGRRGLRRGCGCCCGGGSGALRLQCVRWCFCARGTLARRRRRVVAAWLAVGVGAPLPSARARAGTLLSLSLRPLHAHHIVIRGFCPVIRGFCRHLHWMWFCFADTCTTTSSQRFLQASVIS